VSLEVALWRGIARSVAVHANPVWYLVYVAAPLSAMRPRKPRLLAEYDTQMEADRDDARQCQEGDECAPEQGARGTGSLCHLLP
jgi:hypothetical protein